MTPSPQFAPPSPEQQLTSLHAFNTRFEDFSPVSPHSPKISPQKLATLAHEAEYELLQQHQLDLVHQRRQFEQEETLLLQYRQQLDQLRQTQETERQRIQQTQQVLEYQKQQQENELRRIQQYQNELEQYQRELDDARREQEVQRQILNKQQIDLAQSRIDIEHLRRIQKKIDNNGLSSSAPPMFLPIIEKSHSPNPTALASHAMEEENTVHDRMIHVTSRKRPLSDVLGSDSEEVSHKSNTRRSG